MIKEKNLNIKNYKETKKVLNIIIIILTIFIVFGAIPTGITACAGKRLMAEVEELLAKAKDTDIGNKPIEALELYTKVKENYPKVKTDFVIDKVEFFKDYVNICRLNEVLPISESISAYELFLTNNFGRYVLYDSFAIEAIVDLKLELVQDRQQKLYYEEALDICDSIINQYTVTSTGYVLDEPAVKEEAALLDSESAIEEARLKAETIIPDIYLEWIKSLVSNKEYEKALELLETFYYTLPLVPDFKIEDKYAEIYKSWADQLSNKEEYRKAIEMYEMILLDYPTAKNIQEVEYAIAKTQEDYDVFKKDFKAIAVIEFKTEITRNQENEWQLETVFKETGDKIGYTISGNGLIVDTKGNEWIVEGKTLINRGEVIVPPGGEATNNHWVIGDEFINGYAIFTWSGNDENGNAIQFEEKVHLLP